MVALQSSIEPSANLDSGSILLSADGRLLKLNAIGSAIWSMLAAEPDKRLTVGDILTRLSVSADSPPTISDEVSSFVQQLASRKLLDQSVDEQSFSVRPDVIWSGRQRPFVHITAARKSHYYKSARLQTIQAVFWLYLYSLMVKTKGFAGIRHLVQVPAATMIGAAELAAHCEAVCEAVDRAQTFLFQQALCLQRSVVIARLLRQRGVAAELVIGAHLSPFKSHAWVEVNGRVINDSKNVQRYYEITIQRF